VTGRAGIRDFTGARLARAIILIVAWGFAASSTGLAAPIGEGRAKTRLDPPQFAEVTEIPYKIAVLGALDKVTARVSTLEAPINKAVRFGTLSIIARSCYKRPPEETPEVSAFLEIRDVRDGEDAAPRFSGWMFASSPAVSALEHPVYDVWVTNCKIPLPETESGRE